jgi:hypothetical protein
MKLQVSSKPWILCGDFNVVRQLSEKWGVDSLNAYELEFDNCLNSLEVTDLNFSGCLFTWNNKSEGSRFIARKLDRVLVNEDWLCNFGRTCVDFSSGGISDHSLAFISVGTMVSFGTKPFNFGWKIRISCLGFLIVGVKMSRVFLCSSCVGNSKLLR